MHPFFILCSWRVTWCKHVALLPGIWWSINDGYYEYQSPSSSWWFAQEIAQPLPQYDTFSSFAAIPSLSFSRASVCHFLLQGVRDTRCTPILAAMSMLLYVPSLCLSVTILRPCCRDCMKQVSQLLLTDVLNLDLQLYLNPCPVHVGLAHKSSQSPALGHLLSWLFLVGGIFGGVVCWYLFWQVWVWQKPTVVLLITIFPLLSLCFSKSWIDTPTLCLALPWGLTTFHLHAQIGIYLKYFHCA